MIVDERLTKLDRGVNMTNSMGQGVSRRDFLRLSAGAAASLTLLNALPVHAFAAATPGNSTAISLAECCKMTPLEMTQKSVIVQENYKYLLSTANTIKDNNLRAAVIEILQNPVPTVAQAHNSMAGRESLRSSLIYRGLLKNAVSAENVLPPIPSRGQKPQPFESAPGSGYMSHHSYPGGLVVHTALNIRSTLGLYQGYVDSNAMELDKDVVVAGQLLHDLHKPWVFQWKSDASSLPEFQIAGTGAHHILGIAESIYRNIPNNVILAQASAHDHAGTPEEEAKLINYIKAAATIAGKDPVHLGLLAPNGESLPLPRSTEPFVVYLGDHDWIISVPSAKWAIPLLGKIAKYEYGMSDSDLKGATFNSFRNYIFSQVSIMQVHNLYASQGESAVRDLIHQLIA